MARFARPAKVEPARMPVPEDLDCAHLERKARPTKVRVLYGGGLTEGERRAKALAEWPVSLCRTRGCRTKARLSGYCPKHSVNRRVAIHGADGAEPYVEGTCGWPRKGKGRDATRCRNALGRCPFHRGDRPY